MPTRRARFSQAIDSAAPTLELKTKDGKSAGRVWLRQTPAGIEIVGLPDGSAQAYAKSEFDMQNLKAHVDIWLSALGELPTFDARTDFDQEECEDLLTPVSNRRARCEEQQSREVNFPLELGHLFVRYWSLIPGLTLERYASEALKSGLYYTENRNMIRPTIPPVMEPHVGLKLTDGPGSLFSVSISWDDFPPADSLTLSKIFLAVEFCSGLSACVSTAPGQTGAAPETFNAVTLGKPKTWKITECEYPLRRESPYGDLPTWFLPSTSDLLTGFGAAERDIYTAAATSPPYLTWQEYSPIRLNATDVFCDNGKYLAEKNVFSLSADDAETAKPSPYTRPGKSEAHRLPDRSYLLSTGLATGPWADNVFTSGMGRWMSEKNFGTLVVNHLNPTKGISVAYRGDISVDLDGNVVEPKTNPTVDADIQISPDWRTIVQYEANGSFDDKGDTHIKGWTSKRFCLNTDGKYHACGSGPSGPPPEPRVFQVK
jgi:hypothetical protein